MSVAVSFVALAPDAAISGAALRDDLRSTFALDVADDVDENDNTIALTVGGHCVIYGRMPAPIPWSDLEGPCATSILWPNAAEILRDHAEHVIVTLMADIDPIAQSTLLTQATAALCGTCDQAVGVYWGNATLVVMPEMFRDFAVDVLPEGPPLHIWVDYRVGPGEDGKTAGFTAGMRALGHMEFESLNASEPPGELRDRFMGLGHYLLENGPVIQDGDTIGQDENERIRVFYSDSQFGHEEPVMRLDYESLSGGKPWWKVW